MVNAIFSADRNYRFWLRRRVTPMQVPKINESVCLFVLLNPSTADEFSDDPTIRRCIFFAKKFGHDVLDVVNLFAWRSTDPQKLREVDDPVGVGNDSTIYQAIRGADRVVVAWGNSGALHGRSDLVIDLITESKIPFHFGLTKFGEPRHPLYLANACELIMWRDRPDN